MPMSEVSTMPFQGLLGGKLGSWLLERCATPPAETNTSAPESTGIRVDDTPRLHSLFGTGFSGSVKGCTVLDYGCGYGQTVVSLAKSGAGTAIGLDIRESVLLAARTLARQEEVGERCLFINATDAGAMALLKERIDVVVSIDGFEHYADPEAVLRQIRSLLRLGGKAHISFGPPWWHPYGSHLTFMGVPPWSHVFFKEETILALRAQYRSDGARRFEDVEGGLNRMTIARFERLVRASGFNVNKLDLIPIRGTKLLGCNRWGREIFTSIVRASLVKSSQTV
jgi:ubiquinone/menaquinone biosynthesis C-methylase UbiE